MALALLISVPPTTLMATCQVDIGSPFEDRYDAYRASRHRLAEGPKRFQASPSFRRTAARVPASPLSCRKQAEDLYKGTFSEDEDWSAPISLESICKHLQFSPIKRQQENQENTPPNKQTSPSNLKTLTELKTNLQRGLAAAFGEQSLSKSSDDEDDLDDLFLTLDSPAWAEVVSSESVAKTAATPKKSNPSSRVIVIDQEQTETIDDTDQKDEKVLPKSNLPKPKPLKAKKKRKAKKNPLVIPANYCAETIKAREGLTRSQFKEKRRRNEAPLTPEKKVKRLKKQNSRKVAPKAFKPAFVSPTKTSSYTRSQARHYRATLQESAKQLNDWRATFLDAINPICRELELDKETKIKPSVSRFNTLFLEYFSKEKPDFFDQVYVQNTHVFFWNSNMVDLDLKDSTGQSNRVKLQKGNNFVMYQSKEKGKAPLEKDAKGNLKLTKEATEKDIEPSESNWLHLTQGKAGKSTYKPAELEKGTVVGEIAELFFNKKINIVFAGPRDIHAALHHLMNQFKKKSDPSVHSIPQSYTKERPFANKEVLKRKLNP